MQIDGIMQTAAYGVQSSPQTGNKRDEAAPEEEKEVSRGRDEYIPGGEDADIGLYSPPEAAEDKSEEPEEEKSEVTVCDTDRVDKEIERLRENQEQLEQKLRAAEGENAERIRRQLESVSAELAMKDNDSYRRRNAVFS